MWYLHTQDQGELKRKEETKEGERRKRRTVVSFACKPRT
jgi:hypothetical protein